MIVPNKVIRFNDSIIGKMIIILELLSKQDMTVKELFFVTQGHFDEIDEFIYAIEVLYLLDAIIVDLAKGEVGYVDKD
ncbi:ABC-three component system middle component 7 [Salibacterium sp. K-3]